MIHRFVSHYQQCAWDQEWHSQKICITAFIGYNMADTSVTEYGSWFLLISHYHPPKNITVETPFVTMMQPGQQQGCSML